jgi:tetratricopeptide (TPR) repeat protein
LPGNDRENIYRYNLAIFYFRQDAYDKAMELLRAVHFEDIQYELNARRMLLKIYYEIQSFEALDSLLDSFSQFLRRRKELGYHRENYKNLIAIVRQMLRLHPGDTAAKQALHKKAASMEALVEKSWVLGQLEV